MKLNKLPTLHYAFADDAEKLNRALVDGFMRHIDDPSIKRTHFFGGRYENIYIDSNSIPEIDTVLNTAIKHAAEILSMPATGLKAGLWFNAMGKGEVTTAHRHDDDDELLSAVYYVQIPDQSGQITLFEKNFSISVKPEAGMFVFFPPDMLHDVSANLNDEMRLSLGINIGPA
ncbi:MAG: 2OG-Fe(II) oxygenase family protein [Gammaproteobacteria bacterium]|nr:2OG-Fe(II) oxygenase family protein [Gammaproteobacteria bacterium]